MVTQSSCPGLIYSEITGEPICPRDGFPPEWMTWEDLCAQCRRNQERWMELEGDGEREVT